MDRAREEATHLERAVERQILVSRGPMGQEHFTRGGYGAAQSRRRDLRLWRDDALGDRGEDVSVSASSLAPPTPA